MQQACWNKDMLSCEEYETSSQERTEHSEIRTFGQFVANAQNLDSEEVRI